MITFLLKLLLVGSLTITVYAKQIAITIDDLPFVGSTHNKQKKIQRENTRLKKIISSLKKHNTPATGFVVTGTIEKGQWEILQDFKDAGFEIANHTHNHLNLNQTSANKYIKNIKRADEILKPLYAENKFFRYPYLATGKKQRKLEVENYLNSLGYVIAPVTVDSLDYRFNQALYRIPYSVRKYEKNLNYFKKRYLNFIWRQTVKAERRAERHGLKNANHILLLHANLVNSFFLDDIIEMYQQKGYKLISLSEALKNPAIPLNASKDDWVSQFESISDELLKTPKRNPLAEQ